MDFADIEIELNKQIENINSNYIYIKIDITTDIDLNLEKISIVSINENNNDIGTYLRLDKQDLIMFFIRIDQDNIEIINKNINIYVPCIDNVIQVPILIDQIFGLTKKIVISNMYTG